MPALSQLLPARPAGWHPIDLGPDRFREWHDADHATRSADDGTGTVSAWPGLLSDVTPVQATEAKKPLWYPPGTVGSRSLVWFDGVDDYLRTTTINGLATGSNAGWIAGSGYQASLAASGLVRAVALGSVTNWRAFGCNPKPVIEINPTRVQDRNFTLAGFFAFVGLWANDVQTFWLNGRDPISVPITLNTGTTALTYGAALGGTTGFWFGGFHTWIHGAGLIKQDEAFRLTDWLLRQLD
jgi:hypothetical protein